MDYSRAFAISGSGMSVEKLRVEITAVNIANMHSAAGADGTLFRPLRLVSGPASATFAAQYQDGAGLGLQGVRVLGIDELSVAPRRVYEPGNPSADDKGFVALPGVDHVAEMVNLMTAVRAYEANVVAMNAAKTMAAKALEIGGG